MACMRGLCLKALCVVALVPAYASFRAGASELGPLIKDVQVAAYDRQNVIRCRAFLLWAKR